MVVVNLESSSDVVWIKKENEKIPSECFLCISCLIKEEFSKNKEGNIKTLTNSQRAKNSDVYSKKDILIVILLIVGSNLRNSVTEQENCELDDTHKW